MANSRLAQILQNEYKTKGVVGGAVSALGKRSREKMDIRNSLFSGGGLGSIIGTKVFGKGYSATARTNSPSASATTPSLDNSASNATLQEINTNSKITAKNTLAIPMMARDANITKLNIIKMVKLLGGKPNRGKTDMFWSDSKKREEDYERQFGKKATQISSDGTEKQEAGGFSLFGILGSIGGLIKGLFGAILHGITSLFAGILGPLLSNLLGLLVKGGLIVGIMALIGKYFLEEEFRNSVNKVISNLWSGITPEFKKQLLVGGAILLGAIGVWKTSLFLAGVAIDRFRLKLLGIDVSQLGRRDGPDGPDGRRRRRRGGRFGKVGTVLGIGAFLGTLGYDMTRGMASIPQGEQYERDKQAWIEQGGDPAEFDELHGSDYPAVDIQKKKELGFNTDTASAVGEVGMRGLALYGAYKTAKEGLSTRKPVAPKPPAPPPPKPNNVLSTLKASEDKINDLKKAKSTRWGRFLLFLERKAPKLFARVAVKLATMAGLAAIPFAGWVAALIGGVFAFWDIYELYKLWQEFSGSDTTEEISTSPTPVNQSQTNTSAESVSVVDEYGRVVSTGPNQNTPASAAPAAPAAPSSRTSKRPIQTFKLNKSQSEMASLIHRRFTEAGFTDAQATAAVVNAYAESRLNPKAESPKSAKEESYGLFQMNTVGGLGTGHNPEDLKDPNYNIDLMIKAAKGDVEGYRKASIRFRSTTSLNDAVAAFTKGFERPKNADLRAIERVALATALTGGGNVMSLGGAPSGARTEFASAQDSFNAASTAPYTRPLFSAADLAALTAGMRSPAMPNGGGGMTQAAFVSKATPYDRDFYRGLVATVAL